MNIEFHITQFPIQMKSQDDSPHKADVALSQLQSTNSISVVLKQCNTIGNCYLLEH